MCRGCVWLLVPVALAMLQEAHTARNLFAEFGGVPDVSAVRDGQLRAQGPFLSSDPGRLRRRGVPAARRGTVAAAPVDRDSRHRRVPVHCFRDALERAAARRVVRRYRSRHVALSRRDAGDPLDAGPRLSRRWRSS